jgi:endo-1,4-beta-mannosidase
MKVINLLSLITIAVLYYHVYSAETQYLWAGANHYRIWIQSEQQIDQQLDAMQNAGLKVLRIFLGEAPYQSWESPPDAYTFEPSFGVYDEVNLEKVDYLMRECKERDIKLIIALNNHSDEYFDTYGAIGMYSNSTAIDYYKNRFTHFLNHHNGYFDKKWKDCDDVVLAWEIQNEPGVPLINESSLKSSQKHDLMRNFLNEIATHLKAIDPDTKVSLGIAGYANYYHGGGSGDDIRTLGNIVDADIYTLHFYGGNLEQWIDDNLNWCRNHGKLLFVEEFGLTRGNGMNDLIARYQYVTQICRNKGIPWMFWRLGLRKDDNTWSIFADDSVWTRVVASEAEMINNTQSTDEWDVNVVVDNIQKFENKRPAGFKLYGNYPNPFNASTTIVFSLYGVSQVSIDIYDLTGKLILRLINKKLEPGEHRIQWDASNFSSGTYLYRIRAEKYVALRKCTLIN